MKDAEKLIEVAVVMAAFLAYLLICVIVFLLIA